MQGNRTCVQAHVGPEQTIKARRAAFDKSPLVQIERLQIFFDDDATARRLATEILRVVGAAASEEAPAEKAEASGV